MLIALKALRLDKISSTMWFCAFCLEFLVLLWEVLNRNTDRFLALELTGANKIRLGLEQQSQCWWTWQTCPSSTWGQLTQMAEGILPCAGCLINCWAHYCKLQSLLLCSTVVDSLSGVCLLQTIRSLCLFFGCRGFSFLLPLPALLPSPWIYARDVFWERKSNPTHFRGGSAFPAEISWSDIEETGEVNVQIP